jgi:hypothetical protein
MPAHDDQTVRAALAGRQRGTQLAGAGRWANPRRCECADQRG